MKFLPLLWSNLTRRKVRTICTGLSILVAFVLIGALLSIRAGFSRRVDVTGADRLVVSHRISFTQPLPLVYRDRLAAIPGVAAVTYVAWFRGVYQNPRNDFPKLAVDTESWFEMYDDLWTVPQDQLARWKANRTGAIVGQELAERFGWTIGHRIPIQGTMWPKRGGGAWEFTVEGIYTSPRSGRNPSLDLMFFHYAYFNDTRTVSQDFVDSYRVRVTDPARADDIARQIDAAFANSAFETTTSTENAFVRAIVEQVGDVGAIVIAILAPCCSRSSSSAAIPWRRPCGSARMSSPSSRRSGLLRDGCWASFWRKRSCCRSWREGSASLHGSSFSATNPMNGAVPMSPLSPSDMGLSALIVVLVGLTAGIVPAWQAHRLTIVDALRRGR